MPLFLIKMPFFFYSSPSPPPPRARRRQSYLCGEDSIHIHTVAQHAHTQHAHTQHAGVCPLYALREFIHYIFGHSAGIAHQNGPVRPAFTSQQVARAALARDWVLSVRGDGW